jgi:hypothetical protein
MTLQFSPAAEIKMIDHPITPPPELVKQWRNQWMAIDSDTDSYQNIATQAARWGADQELKACVEYLDYHFAKCESDALYSNRRPKPLSLKEQALQILDQPEWSTEEENIIRRALEQLND